MSKNNQRLCATIDRFEGALAVLEFSHNQNLTVSKKYLPQGVKEGDSIIFEVLTDELLTKRNTNLARAMLEEILNGN